MGALSQDQLDARRSNERHWMIREGQHAALVRLASEWHGRANLLEELRPEDPAARAFRKAATELQDWCERNKMPGPS